MALFQIAAIGSGLNIPGSLEDQIQLYCAARD